MWQRAGLSIVVFLALTAGTQATVYKWVDEKGVTHYTDKPPPSRPSKAIEPAPTPSVPSAPASGKSLEEQEREFQKRRTEREKAKAAKPPAAAKATKPPDAAPSAPTQLTSSKYLRTTRTWVNYEMRHGVLSGTIGLAVEAKEENPAAVWMEVKFEIPPSGTRARGLRDNPDPPLTVVVLPDLVRIAPNDELILESPLAEALRCRPYSVDIEIYADRAGREPIGEHVQRVSGWVNGLKVRSDVQLQEALGAPGKCVPR